MGKIRKKFKKGDGVMNRQTRRFIFGMTSMLLSTMGVAIHMSEIIRESWISSVSNLILFAFSLLGSVCGAIITIGTLRKKIGSK